MVRSTVKDFGANAFQLGIVFVLLPMRGGILVCDAGAVALGYPVSRQHAVLCQLGLPLSRHHLCHRGGRLCLRSCLPAFSQQTRPLGAGQRARTDPAAARIFQICQLHSRQPGSSLQRVRRGSARTDLQPDPAARHFVLHVPVAELLPRHSCRPIQAERKLRQAPALSDVFSAPDRRAHHAPRATDAAIRSAADATIRSDDFRVASFSVGAVQEGFRRRPACGVCRRGLRGARPLPRAWLRAGILFLRLPDLLRFLRLYRHGARRVAYPRHRALREFPPAVFRGFASRILDAMAHFALHLDARLPLYSAGRQSSRAGTLGRGHPGRLRPERTMARCKLDLRAVGPLSRRVIGDRARNAMAVATAHTRGAARLDRARRGDHSNLSSDRRRLDFISRTQSADRHGHVDEF